MVCGDIFPVLFDKYATLLAIPLTEIYNEITKSQVWPVIWKQEFVTVIPKCRNPESMGDLRNISCTMLPSKIYESFVLNWLAVEVSCKKNQYGGVKGCGVSHLLVDMWDEALTSLEDARAAVMMTAIDYAKAFNRLSFQHCLTAFARKGASTEIIRLLATFLSNRVMSVRVNSTWSEPLPVFGGVPQGSILGLLLFNIATDDLEDEENDDRVFIHSSGSSTPTSSHSSKSTGQSSDIQVRNLGSASQYSSSSSGTDVWHSPGDDLSLSGRSPAATSPCSSSSSTANFWHSPPGSPGGDLSLSGRSPAATSLCSSSSSTDDIWHSPPGSPGGGLSLPGMAPVTPSRSTLNPFAPEFVPDGRRQHPTATCPVNVPCRESSPPYGSSAPLLDPERVLLGDEPGTIQPGVCFSSTPRRPGPRGRPRHRETPIRSRGPRLSARDWSFLPWRRNRRRRRNLQRKITYSDEGEQTVIEEVNKKKTGLRWKARKPRKFKFVDDGLLLSKMNMDSAEVLGRVNGTVVKSKLDVQSQNVFRRVVAKAESRGMVVNREKTAILCMSDSQTYKAACKLQDSNGVVLHSGEKMKVLGFHLDSRPTVHAHVAALQVRMRGTAWVLRHLKIAGFTEAELATVYRTVVRPVLDYCAVVYHPMLTDEQDQLVEKLQARALKNIYGYKDSYAVMRAKAGVTTHRQRRIELCDKFAEKAAASPRFDWFPARTARSGRHGEQYQELPARTGRLFNSPLYYYRRRLNGKPGKMYGERNRKYRE